MNPAWSYSLYYNVVVDTGTSEPTGERASKRQDVGMDDFPVLHKYSVSWVLVFLAHRLKAGLDRKRF